MPRRISLSKRPARRPRLTPYAALLIAATLGIPVGLGLALLDWVWF